MSGGPLFGTIIIGLLAGWLAQRSMNRHHGLLTNLAVGLVGALIGQFLAGTPGLDRTGPLFGLAAAAAAAILLLSALALVRRGS
ncbi:MAG TPA: GlsB/YeaQ/YmgE family stress response membrane protein [Caulobacteraceae bacterium]|jgi:uncharacterized membrane protein YeaQ/YmgE (transglycosylase-associated protein family)|nr:GlsB/YeaQ/YmgE family stress response membrane protein [Caulobacteraceae bacterium]